MILKRLHSLTIRAFFPPFLITLFVSVFLFFLVQIVITYLDDLLGKGLGTLDLLRLFAYAWIAIIPQCIPLAVLLASIMSFGNLAENYELAAMKASGISLMRIMRPVMVVIILLAGLTFLFNNFILPVVHLKSTSLLYDIRQKKPAVNIKEGVFYSGIDNFGLLVSRKSANKDTLRDLYIYDHSAHMGNSVQMYARSGKIVTTADTSALIMTLRDGNRYEIADENGDPRKRSLSHLRFIQLQINIPLEDFKLKRTNEELFKGNEEMLNIWQLDSVADSTRRVISGKSLNFRTHSALSFYARTITGENVSRFPSVKIGRFYDSLPANERSNAIENALNISRTLAGNIDALQTSMKGEEDTLMRYLIEWHKKIVICFACIVLFFVGAPLGAIIRKGGLGMPVIVSVLFFLAYYILTEMYLQMALDRKMPPHLAMWMPLVIFLPISVFLTLRAAKDSVIFDATFYYTLFARIFSRRKK